MTQKVLVVDDSRAIRSILSRMFKDYDFEVLQACNGEEAIQVLAGTDSVSLICVDCNMPEMSGIEMTRRLRGMPRFYRIPIIMITTETHALIMEAAMQAGVNEYVMKPFSADAILDKLRILDILRDAA
jgi:two-component system chemotaxis response regulator CheY